MSNSKPVLRKSTRPTNHTSTIEEIAAANAFENYIHDVDNGNTSLSEAEYMETEVPKQLQKLKDAQAEKESNTFIDELDED